MKAFTLKTCIAFVMIIITACRTKYSERLEQQLDSVNQELELTQQALLDAREVEALLDSIDANRKVVHTQLNGEGSNSQDNVTRLNDVNTYIRDINTKMDQMERSLKYVNIMSASILKLQADIDARTKKISMMEMETGKMSHKNKALVQTVHQKDSILASFIETCKQDVSVLEKLMEDINTHNNLATANLYFKQAQALDKAAEDIKSKSKQKIAKQEALEMYRISLSLGKPEARGKIKQLEESLTYY